MREKSFQCPNTAAPKKETEEEEEDLEDVFEKNQMVNVHVSCYFFFTLEKKDF
jgi:hypothetical protein